MNEESSDRRVKEGLSEPQLLPEAVLTTATKPTESGTVKKEKRGVRGWLLFLCLSLVILRGFGFLLSVGSAIMEPDTRILMVLYSISTAYAFSVGVFLWCKARGAVTYAKLFFVIQPYVMTGIWKVYSAIDPAGAQEAAMAIVGALVGFLIWFPYLTFSKRVKATYSITEPNKRSPLLAFVMGAVLGPFGTIYFNIRVCFMAVLGTILAIVLATLSLRFLGFSTPLWMRWVWLAYYPIAMLILTF